MTLAADIPAADCSAVDCSAASRRVDDLTPSETAAVVHAYEAGLLHDGHEDAFALALGAFRGLRPGLPLSVIAAELDLLLACACRTGAPTVFCE